MSKKTQLLLVLAFLLSYRLAYAGIVLNEIMYDYKTGSDDGREWVEVYNNSDTPVDISSYRFFEADTNHKLKVVQGGGSISPRGYALIVSDINKFRINYSNFSGTIFDSSFS